MTIEEAIAHAKEQTEIFVGKHRVFLYLAIEALEKQIPNKPIENPTDDTCLCYENYCPSCENLLVARYKHCPNCGQAIDWSVEE